VDDFRPIFPFAPQLHFASLFIFDPPTLVYRRHVFLTCTRTFCSPGAFHSLRCSLETRVHAPIPFLFLPFWTSEVSPQLLFPSGNIPLPDCCSVQVLTYALTGTRPTRRLSRFIGLFNRGISLPLFLLIKDSPKPSLPQELPRFFFRYFPTYFLIKLLMATHSCR